MKVSREQVHAIVVRLNRSIKKTFEALLPSALAFLSAVGITLGVLGLVMLFEQNQWNMPGSREMWVGLIGALLGGVYTLLGVHLTLEFQKRADNEETRLKNLPLLKLQIFPGNLNKKDRCWSVYKLFRNEIFTSGFPDDFDKTYPMVCISLSNGNPAFDVYIDSCITEFHSKEIKKSAAYAPVKHRLVANESIKHIFWIQDYKKYATSNISGILRIRYSDLFGNRYYQDVSFIYKDVASDFCMTIEYIWAPVLVEEAKPLSELIKLTKND